MFDQVSRCPSCGDVLPAIGNLARYCPFCGYRLDGLPRDPKDVAREFPSMLQKEIVTREIVKVRCKHCDTLVDSTLSKCSNCGARL